MPRRPRPFVAAVTAAVALLAAPTAEAGRVTVSAPFAFGLSPQAEADNPLASLGPTAAYAGSQVVALPRFDDQGGARSLLGAELRVDMTIAGSIAVYDVAAQKPRNPIAPAVYTAAVASGRPPALRNPNPHPIAAAVYEAGLEVGLLGGAEAGPLRAMADFGPPLMLPEANVFLNESAAGTDAATVGLDPLLGPGEVPVTVEAAVVLAYLDAATAGRADGLTAEGVVSLTYRCDAPTPEIPSPPAAAGGLMLLMLGARHARRRWRGSLR